VFDLGVSNTKFLEEANKGGIPVSEGLYNKIVHPEECIFHSGSCDCDFGRYRK
jgi:hypothetical protein